MILLIVGEFEHSRESKMSSNIAKTSTNLAKNDFEIDSILLLLPDLILHLKKDEKVISTTLP